MIRRWIGLFPLVRPVYPFLLSHPTQDIIACLVKAYRSWTSLGPYPNLWTGTWEIGGSDYWLDWIPFLHIMLFLKEGLLPHKKSKCRICFLSISLDLLLSFFRIIHKKIPWKYSAVSIFSVLHLFFGWERSKSSTQQYLILKGQLKGVLKTLPRKNY